MTSTLLTAANTYTDQELLDGIRRRDNAVLSAVYQVFRPRVLALIRNLGGTEHEALDILQEAIVAVFINVQKQEFAFTNGFNAYFHGICQNLWLKKFRDKSRQTHIGSDALDALKMAADVQADGEYAERQAFFMKKFKSLAEGCRELLRLSVIEEKKPEEIVEQLGLGSLNYFYKRKSTCKDKLEALVRTDPNFDQY
ncbi:MAG: sigma-70 family RNA polymerase sigma factor [Saprospiraceae bacterium]|nr:sigma-70 family RNA polymerase sigma factor [Saprospiraceae bacterium]